MKTKIALSTLVLLQVACMSGFSQIRQERDVPEFNGVALNIHATVYLTQGNTQKVEVETTEKAMELVETEVKGDVLQIKCDNWKSLHNADVTVRITVPEYEGLYVSGSGNMIAGKTLQSDEIELKISGSGTIKLQDLQAEEVDVHISGSGKMDLAGNAEEMDVKISGSGSVLAESFSVGESSIMISGSGKCRIMAKDELEAKISGSGRVYYYGNPKVNASVSGSGKVMSGD